MTPQGDHISLSPERGVSLGKAVRQDQRVSQAQRNGHGEPARGSHCRSHARLENNLGRSIEKHVHPSAPTISSPANGSLVTYSGSSHAAPVMEPLFGAKFKYLACKSGAPYQASDRNAVLDLGSCSYFVPAVKAAVVTTQGGEQ